jgi:hypothetical protein
MYPQIERTGIFDVLGTPTAYAIASIGAPTAEMKTIQRGEKVAEADIFTLQARHEPSTMSITKTILRGMPFDDAVEQMRKQLELAAGEHMAKTARA